MRRRNVLLVAPTPQLAVTLFSWLTEAGWEVTLETSFASGKARLDDDPSLLISEVRLGDYNGLHLAIRARARSIPAIVVGHPDPVLQRDADQLGAVYLASEVSRAQLLDVIESIPQGADAPAPRRYSAATNMPFLSWKELPPVGAAPASPPHGPRRSLLS